MSIPVAPAEVISLIGASNTFAILPHEDPDAEALGSAIALQRTLTKQNKAATIFCSGNISLKLPILFGADDFIREVTPRSLELLEGSDLIIICDTNRASRVGCWYEPLLKAMIHIDVLAIDHHIGNYSFDYVWCDPSSSSTAEMLTYLIRKLIGEIPSDIAVCLATGIIGDTGHFTNTNSTSIALETVGYLVRQGANLNHISLYLDSAGRHSAVKLRGKVLSSTQADFNGRYVWASINHRILKRYKVEESELEGLSSYLRTIDGVQISAVFLSGPLNRLVLVYDLLPDLMSNQCAPIFRRWGSQTSSWMYSSIDLTSTQFAIAEKVYTLMTEQN